MYLKENYSGSDYDAFYSNEHCRRENEAIAEVLNAHVAKGNTVLDIGSGTQLTKKLITAPITYIPVDKFYEGDGTITMSAEDYIRQHPEKVDVITSLFSLNYMDPAIIPQIVDHCGFFVYAIYNKPYMAGSNSFYAGKEQHFLDLHTERSKQIERQLTAFADRSLLHQPLLGEPYYHIGVIRGKYEAGR